MPIKELIGNTMYNATKHAVTVLTDGLRKELLLLKSKIRTTVSRTNFLKLIMKIY